mmetsp:Transcript_35533/g.65161  ORF Transcript_35533/g.65161 Transcript_35533/m.65161 type:complete len:96 (+) Transcript_35533:343-630(+)
MSGLPGPPEQGTFIFSSSFDYDSEGYYFQNQRQTLLKQKHTHKTSLLPAPLSIRTTLRKRNGAHPIDHSNELNDVDCVLPYDEDDADSGVVCKFG